ncbi:MAG: hypothetical protein O3A01_01480 [bacterium]|nr:hypothetical protein [bacterium]
MRQLYTLTALIMTLLFWFGTPVFAGFNGSSTTTANVADIIDISVSTLPNQLGDIRVESATNVEIMTLTISNNDNDGFQLTFHSNNGNDFLAGSNQGYLLHDSTDSGVTPNAGQKPSALYILSVIRDTAGTSGLSGQYGTDDTLDGAGFTLEGDHDVNYLNATKSTYSAVLSVELSQVSDTDLFHGNFTDTIQVSIADL